MEPIDIAILNDKAKPKGWKLWIMHLFSYFLLGMIFALFE